MEIRIVDNGKTRYTLQASADVLGRMYDNKAESVVVIKPVREAGHVNISIPDSLSFTNFKGHYIKL